MFGSLFRMLSLFTVLSILAASNGFANPPLKEILTGIQHEISNLEAEVRILEEKGKNQGIAIESLRERLIETDMNQRDLLKGGRTSNDQKVSELESSQKRTDSNLEKLQKYANETSLTLSQYKKKIEELETVLHNQTQHIKTISDAIGSVMAALNIPQKTIPSPQPEAYQVKNGDTLEKIARRNNTSIKKIKDLNQLKNDRIYIGQKLNLP